MITETSAAALVIRNIYEIEVALTQAHKIGESIWSGVVEYLKENLPRDWYVSDYDKKKELIWFAPPQWLTHDDEKTDANPYFTIEEFAGDNGEYDETYAAEFLGAGPSGAGIAVYFTSDNMKRTRYREQLCDLADSRIAGLLQAGVQLDARSWLRMPIKLDADQLAQAAEDEDYTDALAPFGIVLKIFVANVSTFASLVPAAGPEAA